MDRFTAVIVAGVLALVVAGIAAALALRGRETPPDLSTPGGVALAYVQALWREDGEQAWNLLATSTRDETDRERFLQTLSGPGSRRDGGARLTVEGEQVRGEKATVELVWQYPGSGGFFGGGPYSESSTVRLVREDGSWRITDPGYRYSLPKKGRS